MHAYLAGIAGACGGQGYAQLLCFCSILQAGAEDLCKQLWGLRHESKIWDCTVALSSQEELKLVANLVPEEDCYGRPHHCPKKRRTGHHATLDGVKSAPAHAVCLTLASQKKIAESMCMV